MNRFDEIIDRKNTNSLKYDFASQWGKPEDILPLWVADMDFRAPDEVLEAMHRTVEHGIFGYSETRGDYEEKVISWFKKRFSWRAKAEWLVKSPGVVFAINCAVRAFTEPGEAVMIQQPVYYPFAQAVTKNGRELVNNELKYDNERYYMDFEDMEKKIVERHVKLFILCSPHNPVGRVWTREELEKTAEICMKHDVYVISDEIHCDFTYPGHSHIVFASLSKEAQRQCMVCTAPSKTFNLAGLQVSNIFIPDEDRRRLFREELDKVGYHEINVMGLVACEAAYTYGESWLEELKEYLKGNLDFIREFLREQLPQIRLVEPEGTYLAWLDCSGLLLTDDKLEDLIVNGARLWLDAGSMFGKRSGQFERVNMTCPRSVLEEAMERLKKACDELQPEGGRL